MSNIKYDLVTPLVTMPKEYSPLPNSRRTKAALFDLINTTQNELIILAYRLDYDLLVKRLIERANEGITIKIYIDREVVEHKDNTYALQAKKKLEAGGITVNTWSDQELEGYQSLHAKVIISDGEKAIIGSANLTRRAMESNIELGLQIKGPSVKHLHHAINHLFAFKK